MTRHGGGPVVEVPVDGDARERRRVRRLRPEAARLGELPPVARENDETAVRGEGEILDRLVEPLGLQPLRRIGLSVLEREQRLALRRLFPHEDTPPGDRRIDRAGRLDVDPFPLPPQDLFHLRLVELVDVEQGDRIAGLVADDRDDRPRAGPFRDREDPQVGDPEQAALVPGTVVDHRHFTRIRRADDQELVAIGRPLGLAASAQEPTLGTVGVHEPDPRLRARERAGIEEEDDTVIGRGEVEAAARAQVLHDQTALGQGEGLQTGNDGRLSPEPDTLVRGMEDDLLPIVRPHRRPAPVEPGIRLVRDERRLAAVGVDQEQPDLTGGRRGPRGVAPELLHQRVDGLADFLADPGFGCARIRGGRGFRLLGEREPEADQHNRQPRQGYKDALPSHNRPPPSGSAPLRQLSTPRSLQAPVAYGWHQD